VRYHWDEAKRRENLRKHGLDFVDADAMFAGFAVDLLDNRHDYGEIRRVRIRQVSGTVLLVVYTEPDGDTIRIISFRRAGPFERRVYEQALADRLGKGGRDAR
jgi:uncharacterized DUF497 family protein